MKRCLACFVVLCVLLSGCGTGTNEYDAIMNLRKSMDTATGIWFDAQILSDYGEDVHVFSVHCQVNKEGCIAFEVIKPETIRGISGVVDGTGGKIEFEDVSLGFPFLAQGEISPVGAPWLFHKALRQGYIRLTGREGDLLRITIDDSFGGENLSVDVWLSPDNVPVRGEITWEGRRILSLGIENFTIS